MLGEDFLPAAKGARHRRPQQGTFAHSRYARQENVSVGKVGPLLLHLERIIDGRLQRRRKGVGR